MTKYRNYLLVSIIGIFLLISTSYSKNIQTPLGLMDIHGFITQETSWSIASTQDFHNISDLFTMQLEAGFTPAGELGNYVSFYGIFRFRADWAYAINRGSGWWEKGGDSLRGSYNAHHRGHRHEYSWAYGRDRDLDLPREIYADINIGNWSFRIGKQQVVWGESDGIRLMDCINPQDLQFQNWYYDSDEGYESTRIPLWLIKAEYFFPKEWFGGLIRDHSIEFIINPGDIEVDRFNIASGWEEITGKKEMKYVTTFGDYANQGGPWSFPYPWLPGFAQVWPHDMKKRGHMEFAVRFKFNIHDWYITINGFYGYQRMYILRGRGFTFRPDAVATVRRLGAQNVINQIKAGNYAGLDGFSPQELQAFHTLLNSPPLAGIGEGMIRDIGRGGYGKIHAWGGWRNWRVFDLNGNGQIDPGEPIPHLMQFNPDWYYGRMKLVGFTVNKSMGWFRWRNTSPVLRIEAQYEFSKPFANNGTTNGFHFNPAIGGFEGLEWSLLPDYLNQYIGAEHTYAGLVHKDQLRYMIGYDWPIWIYWLNPYENFFTSFQFFHFRTINYGSDELVVSPHSFTRDAVNISLMDFLQRGGNLDAYLDQWHIPRDQFYITYLVQGKYDHQRIIPQILYVHDLNEDTFWIKAKVMFKYGDYWREEIGWLGIFADSDADYHGTGKSFGLTSHSDQIWFKITRQFN